MQQLASGKNEVRPETQSKGAAILYALKHLDLSIEGLEAFISKHSSEPAKPTAPETPKENRNFVVMFPLITELPDQLSNFRERVDRALQLLIEGLT